MDTHKDTLVHQSLNLALALCMPVCEGVVADLEFTTPTER